MENSDAFEMGEAAYDRGDGPEMNPYDPSDAQYDEWNDGWYGAAFHDGEPA